MATRTINTVRKSRLHATNAHNLSMGNWGLIRHTNDSNPFTSLADFNSTATQSYTYTYDDNHGQGEDVDIIFITSSMIYTGNTEYNNADGSSRIQQFQWNTLNSLPTEPVVASSIKGRVNSYVFNGAETDNTILVACATSHSLSVGDTVTLSGIETAPFSIGSDEYIKAGSPDINGTHTVAALGNYAGANTTTQFRINYTFPNTATPSTVGGSTHPYDITYYSSVITGFPTQPTFGGTFNTTIDYSTSAARSEHSEAVVKCACANDYGAASKSNIYIIPRSQVTHSTTYWVLPKLFHQQKGNSRPTLVINSFGDNEAFENLKYIDFRGNRYRTLNGGRSLGSATDSGENTSYETGFHNHNQYRHYRAADTALINEMTAAGVHHVVSAGNAKHKLDASGGIDYNNAILRVYNNLPSSSFYNRATFDTNHSITVGNLHSWFNDGNTTISDTVPFKEVCPYQGEFTNPTSNRGTRVDCYVAGSNLSTLIPKDDAGQHASTNGSNLNGTSFSAPILGGFAALVLSKYPTTTPAQLRKYFRDIAVSSVTLSDKVVQPDNSKGDYGDRDYMHHHTSQNSNLKITYVNPALNYDTSQISDTTISYPTETYVTPSSSSSSSSSGSTSNDGNIMTTTQKLKAINSMLGHIGEAPVNSISNANLPVSVSTAINVLDEISNEVQSEGWHFNTEIEVKYTPVDGAITLTSDIIQFDPVDSSLDIVQRGSSLFDRKNNTTTFTKDVTVNQIRLLTWDSLPEVARRYITLKASRIFQGRIIGSKELEALIARDEYNARANLQEADGRTSDRSMFDNDDVSYRIGINRNYDR
tara:strand:+ start:6995 stop:9445 length:2451 start_codon:yes stop_codon:yes gene_type:complete